MTVHNLLESIARRLQEGSLTLDADVYVGVDELPLEYIESWHDSILLTHK